jgi:thiamine biosynthesis lipoprotein
MPSSRPPVLVTVYQPLMGTTVEIAVLATDPAAAERADRAAVAEIQRLTSVFSTFDEGSELCRWRRGEQTPPGAELGAVLAAAATWHAVSGGAFHPACAELRRHWLSAVESQCLPARDLLQRKADELQALPFRIHEDGSSLTVEQVGDCTGVDLNAVAKGYIVDAAVACAREAAEVDWVTVNAGGDLRHSGSGEITVGVEDPARPYDNSPAPIRVRLADAALATSGSARRGFRIGGVDLGHVIDPRTGWPVTHTASASVLAPTAMTADAGATVAMVLSPQEATAFADAQGLAALVIGADTATHRSTRWPD